ncbi:MAG: nitrogenase component 1 [bacterium]|nr:nitrogenase component 1 [bacterium]
MSRYIETVTPDSLSGAIFAMEGVERAIVLLNGPTGCKYYHSAISDNQLIRQSDFDPLKYPFTWYFGQPRVPCTYVDNDDYVYGGEEKLVAALEFLRDNISFDFIAIVNSPGMSLIGDDIAGIAGRVLGDRPHLAIETPGFSQDVCQGHELAALALLRSIGFDDSVQVVPKRVNILGMSLSQIHHYGDVLEIRRLLEGCGLEVGCALCAGSSLDDIRSIPSAAANIVIYPEFGIETARCLEERFGTPTYVCDGPPIGFAATERMLEGICELAGGSPEAMLEESRTARARAFAFISRVNSISGMPNGVTYAMEGCCSELCSYMEALTGYLGMTLTGATVLNPQTSQWYPLLSQMVAEYGFPEALSVEAGEAQADIVLGSGNTIAALKAQRRVFVGIETSLPTIGYYDLVPKTFLGISGTMQLLECVINALPF